MSSTTGNAKLGSGSGSDRIEGLDANDTSQTFTYDFDQSASKLKINVNATSHNEESVDFCSNTL